MKNVSSSGKSIVILRWIARLFGTFIVLFMSSIFIGAIIEKGSITVSNPEHYILHTLWGISSVGISL